MGNIPKSSLDNDYPDNSNFQATEKENFKDAKVVPTEKLVEKPGVFKSVTRDIFRPNGESLTDIMIERVLIPGIKDLFYNCLCTGFDIAKDSFCTLIFGPDYNPRRRNNDEWVPYSSFSSKRRGGSSIFDDPRLKDADEDRYNPFGTFPSTYELSFKDYGTYVDFMRQSLDWINEYKRISLTDIYRIKSDNQFIPDNAQMQNWGYYEDQFNEHLFDVKTRRGRSGIYYLTLPRPLSLK